MTEPVQLTEPFVGECADGSCPPSSNEVGNKVLVFVAFHIHKRES